MMISIRKTIFDTVFPPAERLKWKYNFATKKLNSSVLQSSIIPIKLHRRSTLEDLTELLGRYYLL